MSHTPKLKKRDPARIVPRKEGCKRLRAIRKLIEAMPEAISESRYRAK